VSAQPFTGGVHIRGVVSTNGTDHMLVLQIWPLPERVLQGLHDHMRDTCNKYLADLQIVSGQITDLTGQGPMQ
jgi:hypothetical protein